MELYFATSNIHKFSEAKAILAEKGVALKHFEFRHTEIRSDSLAEIALEAVHSAFMKIRKPVFVEDTGLFIDSLNGFPGTYSAWVIGKVGCKGILNLLSGSDARSAQFRTAIAFCDADNEKIFEAVCRGSIAKKPSGSSGFGYDPIFMPEGHSQTFAESIELKKELSHRYKSLSELVNYLKEANYF